MFSRAYKTAITLPPLLWVAVFLLVPYTLLLCYSFWSVSPNQTILHSWTLDNYRELLRVNVYFQTLFRSMWIAARVMLFSLLLGYPLAYFLSFHAGKRKDVLLSTGDHPALGELPGSGLRVENYSRQRWRAEHAAAVCTPDETSAGVPALQSVCRGADAHAHLYAFRDPADLRFARAHPAQSGRGLA